MEPTKDAQTVIQQQALELPIDYVLPGVFPDWKTVPTLPPFIQQTCQHIRRDSLLWRPSVMYSVQDTGALNIN